MGYACRMISRASLAIALLCMGCSNRPSETPRAPVAQVSVAKASEDADKPVREAAEEPAREDAASEPIKESGVVLARPTKAEARRVLRSTVPGKLAILAPSVAVNGTDYAYVWRRIDPKKPYEADAVLAVVHGEQVPGGSVEWTLVDSVVFYHAKNPESDEEVPAIPTTLKVGDYDDDGEPELMVRFREYFMVPGGGVNEVTNMIIFDTAPMFGVEIQTELRHGLIANPDSYTEVVVRHVDLNGDGHRDIRINSSYDIGRGDPDFPPERSTNEWLWDAEHDVWVWQSKD